MKKFAIILSFLICSTCIPAIAGPNYMRGHLFDYSTVQGGMLVMLDDGIPDNCSGTPYNWMIISEEDKAMLAMAFMRISQGEMGVTLYSDGTFYKGFCRVVQYDPQPD